MSWSCQAFAVEVSTDLFMQEGVTILRIETSFRVNAVDGALTVTLGDLYAEEKKDFLVRLQVRHMQILQLLCKLPS